MNEEKLETGFQRISHANNDTRYLRTTIPKSIHSFQFKAALLPNYLMTYHDIKSSIAPKSLCDTENMIMKVIRFCSSIDVSIIANQF